jgi:hypothetical protein
MKSSGSSKALNLARDLLTTEQDVQAQRRARSLPNTELSGFLEFLAQLNPPSEKTLRMRKGPRGVTPFKL